MVFMTRPHSQRSNFRLLKVDFVVQTRLAQVIQPLADSGYALGKII